MPCCLPRFYRKFDQNTCKSQDSQGRKQLPLISLPDLVLINSHWPFAEAFMSCIQKWLPRPLIHNFPRHKSETVQPVDPLNVSLAGFEGGGYIFLSPTIADFVSFFKDGQEKQVLVAFSDASCLVYYFMRQGLLKIPWLELQSVLASSFCIDLFAISIISSLFSHTSLLICPDVFLNVEIDLSWRRRMLSYATEFLCPSQINPSFLKRYFFFPLVSRDLLFKLHFFTPVRTMKSIITCFSQP